MARVADQVLVNLIRRSGIAALNESDFGRVAPRTDPCRGFSALAFSHTPSPAAVSTPRPYCTNQRPLSLKLGRPAQKRRLQHPKRTWHRGRIMTVADGSGATRPSAYPRHRAEGGIMPDRAPADEKTRLMPATTPLDSAL